MSTHKWADIKARKFSPEKLAEIQKNVDNDVNEINLNILRALESKQNEGQGVSCVRSIIAYLERGDLESARVVADIDHDKIRNYPEIEANLWMILWQPGQTAPKWWCRKQRENGWVTQIPDHTTKFVVLEGIKEGNTFWSSFVQGEDPTKLTDNTIAYRVLGYCETSAEAQIFLYGEVMG